MTRLASRLGLIVAVSAAIGLQSLLAAQEQSVRPGINREFVQPNVKRFVQIFESEGREICAARHAIVDACRIEPGVHVADIGAGTGLFTRLFAEEVGPTGKVFAVDIAKEFVEHTLQSCEADEC